VHYQGVFTLTMKEPDMSASITTAPRSRTAVQRRPAMAWVCACTALLMGLSAVSAQAQPRDPRRDTHAKDRPAPHHVQPRHQPPPQVRPHPGPRAHVPMRGAGPDHRWHRGDRIPPTYRTHHYVVNDWRGHHLHQPPRGYHWVQYGSDYLLVAIATGVIAQLILSQ
jgi:Ni/Co efflux regulator RcnB